MGKEDRCVTVDCRIFGDEWTRKIRIELLCETPPNLSDTPVWNTLWYNSRESIIFRSHLELRRCGYKHKSNSCHRELGFWNPPIQRNIIPRGTNFRRSDISSTDWRDDPSGQLLHNFYDAIFFKPIIAHKRRFSQSQIVTKYKLFIVKNFLSLIFSQIYISAKNSF